MQSVNTENLLGYVRRRLREEGPKNWPAIAEASKKPVSTLRKIAYGDRNNPRLDTIEPIADELRVRESH